MLIVAILAIPQKLALSSIESALFGGTDLQSLLGLGPFPSVILLRLFQKKTKSFWATIHSQLLRLVLGFLDGFSSSSLRSLLYCFVASGYSFLFSACFSSGNVFWKKRSSSILACRISTDGGSWQRGDDGTKCFPLIAAYSWTLCPRKCSPIPGHALDFGAARDVVREFLVTHKHVVVQDIKRTPLEQA